MKGEVHMRGSYGCALFSMALVTAFTLNAVTTWADPPPLPQAEAAIRAEDCLLPLTSAWADPPPLALAEARTWTEN